MSNRIGTEVKTLGGNDPWAQGQAFETVEQMQATIASQAAQIERLREAGNAQTDILRAAQEILTRYLIPDGIDGPQTINELLGLLDGSAQRSAQFNWDAALQPKEGEGWLSAPTKITPSSTLAIWLMLLAT